jgi:hypothetical protein
VCQRPDQLSDRDGKADQHAGQQVDKDDPDKVAK